MHHGLWPSKYAPTQCHANSPPCLEDPEQNYDVQQVKVGEFTSTLLQNLELTQIGRNDARDYPSALNCLCCLLMATMTGNQSSEF
jgi:hypothetical protein